MTQASRDFVNVRLNPWHGKVNHDRLLTYVKGHFGSRSNQQNTVWAMFEPQAAGLSADSFPTEDVAHFGTRAGKRHPIMPDLKVPMERLVKMIAKLRSDDTGDPNPDMQVVERIAWEYLNSRDGNEVAQIMRDLSAKHPAKPESRDQTPVLPVMPDLKQTIDIAAADSRAAILVVHADAVDEELERNLAQLAFEDGLAGRSHLVRLTAAEYAAAKARGQVHGGELASGVMLVAPRVFGLEGDVWSETPGHVGLSELRTWMHDALAKFHAKWRKPDRRTLLAEGSEKGIVWAEYNPDIERIEPIPIVRPDESPEQEPE